MILENALNLASYWQVWKKPIQVLEFVYIKYSKKIILQLIW